MYLYVVFSNGVLLDEAAIVLISWYIAYANKTGYVVDSLNSWIHHTYILDIINQIIQFPQPLLSTASPELHTPLLPPLPLLLPITP